MTGVELMTRYKVTKFPQLVVLPFGTAHAAVGIHTHRRQSKYDGGRWTSIPCNVYLCAALDVLCGTWHVTYMCHAGKKKWRKYDGSMDYGPLREFLDSLALETAVSSSVDDFYKPFHIPPDFSVLPR